ncbi:MAG: DNA repair exonuclease [Firmicutes bacterium]|jgi:DNA repair exonuclease SbcCD nuclease subunit|nr:DNA repair exonuclease [Bacillota bacterium]
MGFTFVHAADLHLGSFFSGIEELAPDLKKRAINASLKAFENLVQYCLDTQVDFVLFAGDVFETAEPGLLIQKHFIGQIERLQASGIDIFVVTGNHDANVFEHFIFPLPDNFFIFSASEAECISRSYKNQPVTITGVSYPQPHVGDLSPMFPRPNPGSFNIAVLHCDVGSREFGYAPVALTDLEALGYHYWAIGHVHSAKRWETSCVIQYPGILQGRDKAESGPKGFYVVTVEANTVIDTKFVVQQDVVWQTKELDLSQAIPEQLPYILLEAKDEKRAQYPVGTMLQLKLTGTSACYGMLKQEGTIEDLLTELRRGEEQRADFVWVAELDDQTLPEIDWEEIRQQGDFLAEVIAFMEQMEAGSINIDAEAVAASENVALSLGITLDREGLLHNAKLIAVQLLWGGGQGE